MSVKPIRTRVRKQKVENTTNVHLDDIDNDGILNANDNCPDVPNPNQ